MCVKLHIICHRAGMNRNQHSSMNLKSTDSPLKPHPAHYQMNGVGATVFWSSWWARAAFPTAWVYAVLANMPVCGQDMLLS